MYPEEASDNFNTIVLPREKTITEDRHVKWLALFSNEFYNEITQFYLTLLDYKYYEEAYEILKLIHLLSLVRPSFLIKPNKRYELTNFMTNFCIDLMTTKNGFENSQILLKFCQILSTFHK